MRRCGRLSTARGLGPQDHVCWLYNDDDEFRATVVEYLDDGARLGQRLMYVGAEPPTVLAGQLAGLDHRDDWIAAGRLEVVSLPDVDDTARPVDPEPQLAVYVEATERALRDGHAGLRVVADVTTVIGDPDRRQARARFEHLADAYAAAHPFSGMCAIDGRKVPAEDVVELACAHPLVHAPEHIATFGLFAADAGYALWGELDTWTAPTLTLALGRIPVATDPVVVDCQELRFIDHHAIQALAAFADDLNDTSNRLVLRNSSPTMQRVWDMLDLSHANVSFS